MAGKQIALDLAAFLDADGVRVLTAPRAEVRRIAEAFLTVCYDELGKLPRLLDGQDVQQAVGELLPGRLAPRDPAAEHVAPTLEAFFDHLEATQVVSQAFEVRSALPAACRRCHEAVASGRNAERQVAAPAKPFVHGAAKLGRNDPCSCGSGKKFKKCHGKGA
jgi:hypothetical protein